MIITREPRLFENLSLSIAQSNTYVFSWKSTLGNQRIPASRHIRSDYSWSQFFVNSSVEQRRRRRRQRWRREEQWKKNEMRWSVWSRVRAQCNRITDLDHLTSPSGIEERRFRERTRSHDYIPPFSTLSGIFIAIIHIIHTAFFSDLPIQGGRQRQTTSVILSGDVFSRSRFENSLRVAIVLRDLLLELKSTNLFGLTRSKGRWNVPRRKRSVSRKLRF